MKKSFYCRLAWTGIRKNSRFYTPFLLTCIGTVMMFYIVSYLATLPDLVPMKGGATMGTVMGLGKAVIAFFSVIFLFYTHSFLIRRRNLEFGLYNILGMDKHHIGRILFWETLIVGAISLVLGIGFGILLSKLAELAMVKMLSGEVVYSMTVYTDGILHTVGLFSAIFLLLLLVSLARIHLTNPLSLLRSDNYGEKPPRANWFLAVLGLVILGGAYYLAISIKQPISALIWFFVAVLMVILATYLLFIAGSVALCKLLQKNKKYYYRSNHFISVSSMAYRMKRNGAGLASICILMTMVLVMLSSTGSLMLGGEASLRKAYPYDLQVSYFLNSPEYPDEAFAEELYDYVISETNGQAVDSIRFTVSSTAGILEQDHNFQLDASAISGFDSSTYDNVRMIYIISLEDYNRIAGTQTVLAPDSLLVYGNMEDYPYDSVSFQGGKAYRIQQTLSQFPHGLQSAEPVSTYFFVAKNPGELVAPLADQRNSFGSSLVRVDFTVGCNMASGNPEDAEPIADRLFDLYHETSEGTYGYSVNCFSGIRDDFYSLYGSLFCLGILLSIVFLSATVLMIYYKQISEGFEDQARFDIMQKVGLTKAEIRKSVNSQILTVFFLPLLLAGIHAAFAFPMIWRIIQFMGVFELKVLIPINVGCFVVFGLFYALVYRITSNIYYKIVSA